ncbi:MAG: ribosome rescue protein RqcH [Nitrososphaerota archaeon]|nr:NFACT family protein [Candidatus Bathyarchaeota archaeon]MDW8022835.1 ribosome rescue protein RqcH [Nitrososphaerota archaeon]
MGKRVVELRVKEFTSFDVAAVVRELKGLILNSRVNNVYQLDGKTLLLKLRGADGAVFILILEAGRRLHVTSYALDKPLVPPPFCMALRKYLNGGWLANVEQYEFERIVIFHFKAKGQFFKLIIELFGEGNIILVDGENRILQALRYRRMRDRDILRGEPFRFPPPMGHNPIKISRQAFLGGLRSFGEIEIVKVLASFLGIGGVYAEEVLLRLGVEKKSPCNSLDASKAEAIYNCVQGLIFQVLDGKLEPNIVLDEKGELVDAVPIKLKRYESLKHQTYGKFNEALDEFYARAKVLEGIDAKEKVDEFEAEVERLRRMMAEQEKALKETEKNVEKYKRIGDLIYMHSGKLQTLLDKFLEGKKAGKEWKEIISEILTGKRRGLEPDNLFEAFDSQRMIVNVCVDGLPFSLELNKDLFANAAKFYERAKTAKRKLEGVKTALEETRNRLKEAEAKLREAKIQKQAKPAEALKELAKRKVKGKKWFEKFRWFTSSDGFLVVAGKDASSNEALIKRYTEPSDIVFHADVTGAPFVVIKTGGKQPSEQCLREASEFAATFSRNWREGFASADVYWVKPEQLSKTGGSGEYVPRGAFVVTGKRNWMRGVPLRTAIGALIDEETGEIAFLGGPVDAVKARTKAYVTIVPGDANGKELFKNVLKELAEKMANEHQEKILKTSPEKIRDFIPYGKGKLLTE